MQTRLWLPLLIIILLSRDADAMTDESSKTLKDYRWTYRILLYEESPEAEKIDWSKLLETYRGELELRHLRFICLGPQGGERPLHLGLSAGEKNRLRRQKMPEEKRSVYILIGKDGGIKYRQEGELVLEEIFAAIDRMPMRRQEMRKQGEHP